MPGEALQYYLKEYNTTQQEAIFEIEFKNSKHIQVHWVSCGLIAEVNINGFDTQDMKILGN